jgi:hypothetical protein
MFPGRISLPFTARVPPRFTIPFLIAPIISGSLEPSLRPPEGFAIFISISKSPTIPSEFASRTTPSITPAAGDEAHEMANSLLHILLLIQEKRRITAVYTRSFVYAAPMGAADTDTKRRLLRTANGAGRHLRDNRFYDFPKRPLFSFP